MAKLVWDQTGERLYHTGVKKGVVYPQVKGAYPAGEAWNGLVSVTESPSGAEPTALYANDQKYLEMTSLEEFGFSLEAYMYPDAFAECNGEASLATGVTVGQQTRKAFGMTYTTTIGNDEVGNEYGYIIHIVYGAKAAPSERAHTSINDSPEAETMSWECTTTPVEINGHKAASHIAIDSTKADKDKIAALEAILYGTEDAEARLPLPAEIMTIFGAAASEEGTEG